MGWLVVIFCYMIEVESMNIGNLLNAVMIGALVFLVATPARSWTIDENFDGQNTGDKCQGWSSTTSVVTNKQGASGSKSCLLRIGSGATGFGKWGGIVRASNTAQAR